MEGLTLVVMGWRVGPVAVAFRAVALSGDRVGRCRSESQRDQRECDSTHSKTPTCNSRIQQNSIVELTIYLSGISDVFRRQPPQNETLALAGTRVLRGA